jgi:hypothetical protein
LLIAALAIGTVMKTLAARRALKQSLENSKATHS